MESLTPEGQWTVIVHHPVRGFHLDHPEARENFERGKRRAFFEHLEEIRRVADRYNSAPLGFYGDRRLHWQQSELHSLEGRWLTELIVA